VPTRKTWIWIIVGVIGTCVLLLMAVAGAGIYFVSSRIHTKTATTGDAFKQFDAARAAFKDQRPLIEVDALDAPRITKPLASFPTSPTKPQELLVMAWNPDDERVVQVSMPFWLLKLGGRNMDFGNQGHGLNLDRLNLDIQELERIGPMLVLDLRAPSGQRVIVWTK
jgi:hypothetical protein